MYVFTRMLICEPCVSMPERGFSGQRISMELAAGVIEGFHLQLFLRLQALTGLTESLPFPSAKPPFFPLWRFSLSFAFPHTPKTIRSAFS